MKKKKILVARMRTRDTYFVFTEASIESKYEAHFLNMDHPLHYWLCGRMLFWSTPHN